MKIAVRVDSSNLMGTGHARRCLSLAKDLRSLGHDISFISRDFAGNLIPVIEREGFKVAELKSFLPQENSEDYSGWLPEGWAKDAEETKSALSKTDFLIVDHYSIDFRWHQSVREKVNKILVIDDLANRRYDCDIILDQNYYKNLEVRYEGLVPNHCRKLLGPQYILFSQTFLRSLNRNRSKLEKILVSFGGSDPTDETSKTLNALGEFPLDVKVVIGRANPQLPLMEKKFPKYHFISDAQNMADLILEADLSVGGGGTTAYERCLLGLPSLVIAVAENQVALSENLADLGAITYLGTSKSVSSEMIRSAIRKYIADPVKLELASRKAICLWEKRPTGARGVAKELIKILVSGGVLDFRDATMKDSARLLAWRNDAVTRENSIQTNLVSREEHDNWLSRVLCRPDCKLSIVESSGIPVGTVRLDLSSKELSWTVAPEYRGIGLGKSLVEQAIMIYGPNITAKIKKQNVASIRIVEALGFKMQSQSGDLTIWKK
jgi:UDP-2,4-diacetamido-2,4,6-trideoxy-beta-L-altropyranose hydrolase